MNDSVDFTMQRLCQMEDAQNYPPYEYGGRERLAAGERLRFGKRWPRRKDRKDKGEAQVRVGEEAA